MRKGTFRERERLRHVANPPRRFRGDKKGKKGGKREKEKSKTIKMVMTPLVNRGRTKQ